MLYLLTGCENERKEYIRNLLQKLKIKAEHIYQEDIKEKNIQDIIIPQQGFFGNISCYVLHDLSRDLPLKDLFLFWLESPHSIIFSEDSLLKKEKDIFIEYQATCIDFPKKKQIKKYDLFILADYFGKRDKKNLWLEFQQAKDYASLEEIHGMLFWQIKNLLLVQQSEKNPGMHPYVYKKNVNFSKKFQKEELQKLTRNCFSMFHFRKSHKTLDIEIEEMILSL